LFGETTALYTFVLSTLRHIIVVAVVVVVNLLGRIFSSYLPIANDTERAAKYCKCNIKNTRHKD
jgi:hypothetical protein